MNDTHRQEEEDDDYVAVSNWGTFRAACSLIFRLYISLLLMYLANKGKNKKRTMRKWLYGEMVVDYYCDGNRGKREWTQCTKYDVRRIGWRQ